MRLIKFEIDGHIYPKTGKAPIAELSEPCPHGHDRWVKTRAGCNGCTEFKGFEDWETVRCAHG